MTLPASGDAPALRHVYVHVPFCARRCSYCDFAIAVRSVTPVDAYLEGLARELAVRVPETAGSTPIETLYFGGGTPSRLGAEGLAAALDLIGARFALAPDAEVTVEANPEDLDAGTVRAWREVGINRVSLGVQSFDPAVLAWMHRSHDVDDVYRAAEALVAGGITNWSLDLIYALPSEMPRDWSRDLSLAIDLAPPHLSAYGLTIEAGTPLARWRDRGDVHDADEGRFERDFLEAHDRLEEAGMVHYEVSNWGRPGFVSRHNSAYWHHVPYLGLGPGAHGFDGGARRWNEREYARWLARLQHDEDPIAGAETLSVEERALESAYVGLRTLSGVVLRSADEPLAERWIAEGWGRRVGDRLVLSANGWLRLDALVAALTEHRSRY